MFGSGRLPGVRNGRSSLLRTGCRLLLLHGGGGLHGGRVSDHVGLWDNGGLLRLVRLLGDLPGVLLHLLPHVERPIGEGRHDVRAAC